MQVPTASLTPRVLQPSPLKESRPEIRCDGLFKGREACYPIPTSASALGYLASSIREAVG
jgi:hypothetical protein